MTFKDLIAKITGLEARAESAFKAELTELKGLVTGQMTHLQEDLTSAQASITDLTGRLATATADLSAANGSLAEIKTSLTSAATALRSHLSALPGHADYKDGGPKAGATLTELIAAEQNATNNAISATGVKVNVLPAGGKAPESATTAPKNLTDACLAANKKAN